CGSAIRKAAPRALTQAMSLIRRVMWCCPVLKFFIRFSSFSYSDLSPPCTKNADDGAAASTSLPLTVLTSGASEIFRAEWDEAAAMGCLAATHRPGRLRQRFRGRGPAADNVWMIIGEPLEGTLPCGETNTLIVCFCR